MSVYMAANVYCNRKSCNMCRICLLYTSSASDTLAEATAPVKLPTRHCPPAGSRLQVRSPVLQGWYPNIDSDASGDTSSQSPTYPVHAIPNPSKMCIRDSHNSILFLKINEWKNIKRNGVHRKTTVHFIRSFSNTSF